MSDGRGEDGSAPGSREPVEAPLEKPAAHLIEPFQNFVGTQSASGWTLLAATCVALVIANSPFAEYYDSLKEARLGITTGSAGLALSLQHWVNDGLMAVFFFLLGLELKREVLVGRLQEPRSAGSVLAGAVGGMAIPALLFLSVTGSAEVRSAWAIPMATDTAFALTVLVLLRDHVPAAARAFLVGLAIVDDLGAILVIALAYTSELETSLLLPAALVVAILIALNLVGVRRAWPYWAAGGALWLLFLALGLHGTLAGVVAALLAPVRPAMSRGAFAEYLRSRLRRFNARLDDEGSTILENPRQHDIAQDVRRAAERATAPLQRWEDRLEKPVSFVIVPLFAFMNAGVSLDSSSLVAAWNSELSAGVLLGLIVGKPVGILLGVSLGRLTGLADMPDGLDWRVLFGLGLLGAIGFTMSLFIGTLSFQDQPALLDVAKQSILATSFGAGVAGYLWLRWSARRAARGSE